MKTKLIFFSALFYLSAAIGIAQQITFSMSNASMQTFRGKIFCCGLITKEHHSYLQLYRLTDLLTKSDSVTVEVSAFSPEDYLRISADTLHGYLNIYIQKKETPLVDIFRFNYQLQKIAQVQKVEIARLNSRNVFPDEPLYQHNLVYSLRQIRDSSGVQYYLNKYELKSATTNFEYQLKWQFPFDKKDITAAQVFYADQKIVYVYVARTAGPLTSQWILKLNAVEGALIKAIKLSEKDEKFKYEFGNFKVNSASKQIFLCGQKVSGSEEPFMTNEKINSVLLWTTLIDSTGEILSKTTHTIATAFKDEGSGKKKSNAAIRINKVVERSNQHYDLETDIYRISSGESCYKYCNTITLKLEQTTEGSTLQKNLITAQPEIDYYFRSQDKLNRSGKLCRDNFASTEGFFYEQIKDNPRPAFTMDKNGASMWVLKKFELRSNSVNYSVVRPVKNLYKVENILSISTAENPQLIAAEKSFIISRQIEPSNYQLNLFIW